MKKINKFWLFYILFVVLLIGLYVYTSCIDISAATVDGVERGNDFYVMIPQEQEFENTLLTLDLVNTLPCNEQALSYYLDYDNYDFIVTTKYLYDDDDDLVIKSLPFTYCYFIPKYYSVIRDITNTDGVYSPYLRYVPFHNARCIENYDNLACGNDNHINSPLSTNIWYSTDKHVYFRWVYNYSTDQWEYSNFSSSNSTGGFRIDVSYVEVQYSSIEIFYYVKSSTDNVYHNMGTRYVYNESGKVVGKDSVLELHYNYSDEALNQSKPSYSDDDIHIELDNGNQFEYEEITDSDDVFETILKHIKNMWRAMLNTINNIRQLPTTIIQGAYDYIGKPVNAIYKLVYDIPYNIGVKIGEIFNDLFVPDDDYLKNKFSSLSDSFPFVSSVKDFVYYCLDYFERTAFDEAPKIEIDFSNSEGKYNYGGKVAVIDLTWFSRYKPYTDVILSAFFWFRFYWSLFYKLPSVINGVDSLK